MDFRSPQARANDKPSYGSPYPPQPINGKSGGTKKRLQKTYFRIFDPEVKTIIFGTPPHVPMHTTVTAAEPVGRTWRKNGAASEEGTHDSWFTVGHGNTVLLTIKTLFERFTPYLCPCPEILKGSADQKHLEKFVQF
ncbi:hypothetical protein AVEN_156561-1 [Araneus ventricosus]|uniref:Uncharacterized protein n=1 Tax=Araneus ventricosus TaxID=182803 RepID=A0A4Y2RS21_ARAVE|nr:hypothetical protein AVEN_156561-1 [Araneus ventricosus]